MYESSAASSTARYIVVPSDRHIFWSCRIEFYHSSLRSVYYLSYVVNTTVIRYCNNSEGLLTNFSTLRHTSQIRHAIFFSNVKVLVTLLNKLALTPQLFFFFCCCCFIKVSQTPFKNYPQSRCYNSLTYATGLDYLINPKKERKKKTLDIRRYFKKESEKVADQHWFQLSLMCFIIIFG